MKTAMRHVILAISRDQNARTDTGARSRSLNDVRRARRWRDHHERRRRDRAYRLQLTCFTMTDPNPRQTQANRESQRHTRERDPGRERSPVADRYDAHRRWIGGDPDDPCCRGFD
jgi:hypothetical protein